MACGGAAIGFAAAATLKPPQPQAAVLPDAECPFGPALQKYWDRRYELFSLFDRGVQLDQEGLFSAASELHALEVGLQLPAESHCVLDAFCGVGGNAIGFARAGKRVIAVDTCAERLEMARQNARVYGVEGRISFVHGNAMDVMHHDAYTFDCVHFDPPWGGPGYSKDKPFLWNHFAVDGTALIIAAHQRGCRRIVFRVPRTFDLREVTAKLDVPYDLTMRRMFDGRAKESYWMLHLVLPPAPTPGGVNVRAVSM